MNRLQQLFRNKQNNILSIYFTAGYPTINSTGEIIQTLAEHGADMVEIGVPFSDPMADGVVIQESSTQALRNGMTVNLLIEQAKAIRPKCNIPFVLMGYLNPMLQYGIEKLFKTCSEIGIDAIIIPDLPFKDYMESYKPLCDKYNLPIIMLITPETSDERIQLIDNHCNGFIYMVSSASTTGTRDRFSDSQIDYFKRIDHLTLRNRRLIGFGISNKDTLNAAYKHSSGAIIGSLFVKCLSSTSNISDAVHKLFDTLEK